MYFQVGYGTAMAVIMFAVLLVISIIQLVAFPRPRIGDLAMTVVGARFQQERQQKENLRNRLYITAVAVFRIYLDVTRALDFGHFAAARTSAATQFGEFDSKSVHHRELDIHPRERSTVEMDGQ